MTTADKPNNEIVWYKCPFEGCPCIFLTKADLDRHIQAKEFRILGKEPNQYDHIIQWKNILFYRDKREPYEKDLGSY
jgi:hypothetical protein